MTDRDEIDKKKGSKYISGTSELCECPKCGATKPREQGLPCTEEICPNCGTKMIRSM